MSRTSSTFGKQFSLKSSMKLGGSILGPSSSEKPTFSKSVMKRSGSLNNLRNSTNMNMSLNTLNGLSTTDPKVSTARLSRAASEDVERIEANYIKNLQQQIYFLELESNYLREHTRKATDSHPTMMSEAENMLLKLKQMQQEIAALHTDAQKKEALIERAVKDKEKVLSKLREVEEVHAREKHLLIDDLVTAQKSTEASKTDISRKDVQLGQAHDEMDKSIKILTENELKMKKLSREMEEMSSQHRITHDALEVKRAELLECETKLRNIEEKYYTDVTSQEEDLVEDLREDVKMLRQKLKEAELIADQDRYVKEKITVDSAQLVKENAGLSQQVEELQKQVEREKRLREKQDNRRSESLSQLVSSEEKEKFLRFELDQTRELLKTERDRNKEFMEQLGQKEQLSTSQELSNSTTRARLSEVQHARDTMERDNSDLRREKMLLSDHVAELQKQLESKQSEAEELQSENDRLTERLDAVSHLKDFEGSLQAQKWEEFSRLADSMKRLSTAMHTPSNGHSSIHAPSNGHSSHFL